MPGGHGLIMVSFLGGPQWSQRPQEGRGVAERDQVVGHDAVALRVALGPGPPSAFRLACSRYLPGAGCPPGEGRSPVGGSPSGHTHQARATWPLASPARRGPLPGGAARQAKSPFGSCPPNARHRRLASPQAEPPVRSGAPSGPCPPGACHSAGSRHLPARGCPPGGGSSSLPSRLAADLGRGEHQAVPGPAQPPGPGRLRGACQSLGHSVVGASDAERAPQRLPVGSLLL